MWRRGLLLGALALPACGFRPLYGPDGGEGRAGFAGEPRLIEEMAAVRVALIPERNGQLLRRALQRAFEDQRPGTPARYELRASLAYTVEPLGFRRDGTISRLRTLASAPWALTTAGTPPEVLERGMARTLDAYNIPDLQFFAADSSRDDMDRRIVAELADRITVAVAAALRRRLAA